MANYTISDNPQYTTEIRKLQNTDPGNAESVFNPLVQTLVENTHAVKLETDKKANSSHTHLPGDCGLGKNLTLTGAVTGTYNGQAPASFLIPDRKGCRFVDGQQKQCETAGQWQCYSAQAHVEWDCCKWCYPSNRQ